MDTITTYSRLGSRIRTFSCRAAAWLREQRAASPMSEYGSLRPWVNANLWLWSIVTAGVFASFMSFAMVMAQFDAIILLFEQMNFE